jgi:hypothetical protein
LTKAGVSDPKWLTKDIKKIFKHEVCVLPTGLRLTKLVSKSKKL